MTQLSPSELLHGCEEVRPTYDRLAQAARSMCAKEAAIRGLHVARIDARAKDPVSTYRKLILQGKDLSDIGDLAGVRVVGKYYSQIPEFHEMFLDLFEIVQDYDDKRAEWNYRELGYAGIHYQLTLRGPYPGLEDLGDLEFELQLHTPGGSAWADVAHDSVYKTPAGVHIPDRLKRDITRLVALAEVFDSEVDRTWQAIMSETPMPEALLRERLERAFLPISEVGSDQELSMAIIHELLGLYEGYQEAARRAEEYLEAHGPKIREFIDEYRNATRRSPLLFQPESLLIFERLDADPYVLQEAWNAALPPDLLADLATSWGEPLP